MKLTAGADFDQRHFQKKRHPASTSATSRGASVAICASTWPTAASSNDDEAVKLWSCAYEPGWEPQI